MCNERLLGGDKFCKRAALMLAAGAACLAGISLARLQATPGGVQDSPVLLQGIQEPLLNDLLPYLKKPKWFDNTGACAVVIKRLSAQSLWQDSLSFFADMVEHGALPEPVVCNAVLGSFERTARWEWSVLMLEQMVTMGVAPDIGSYRNAISACCKSKKWEWSLALLSDLQGRGYLADRKTVRLVISTCEACRKRVIAGALQQGLERQLVVDATTEPRGSNVYHAAYRGRPEKQLTEAGPQTYSVDSVRSAAWVQGVLDALRDPEVRSQKEVLDLVSQMVKKRKLSIKEQAIMMSGLGDRGLWRSALTLFNQMKEKREEPDVKHYTLLMKACEKSKQWRHALALLAEMLDAEVLPDSVTCHQAMRVCEVSGRWELAFQVMHLTRDLCFDPNAASFSFALKAAGSGRHWEASVAMLADMRRGGAAPDARHYLAVLGALAPGGRWAEAAHLVEEARSGGLALPPATYDAAIASCSAKWTCALQLLEDMQRCRLTPAASTYNALLGVCNRRDSLEVAIDLFDEAVQRNAYLDRKVYDDMLAASLHRHAWTTAMRGLRQMLEIGVVPQVSVYNGVLAGCYKSNHWAQVLRFFMRMEEFGLEPEPAVRRLEASTRRALRRATRGAAG